MNRNSVSIIASLLMLCSLQVNCGRPAMCADSNLEQTTDKQRAWLVDRMKEHVKVIALRNGKVHFESDGFFHSGASDMAKTFDKGKGEEFSTAADHHSSIKLKIKEFSKEKGVTIEYLSRFDHRSFGKNMTTEDRGEFTLPWK